MKNLTLRPRQIALAAALAGAAALIPVATIAASASHASAVPPRCTRSQLTAWMAMPSLGLAALTTYYDLEVSNVSRHGCALDGFPDVTAVSDTGRQLGSPAGRDANNYRARRVVIPAGGTAHFLLGITGDAWSTSACRPTTAEGLRVVAPGTRGGMVFPYSFPACARRGPVYLWATPIAANVGIPRYN